MADRFRRGRVSRGSQRKTEWIGFADQGMLAVTGNTNQIVGNLPFTDPATFVRARGLFSVGVQATSADKTILGAFGAAIVTDQAFAAGAASIPGPWTENDWGGWFVHQVFSLQFEFTTDIGWNIIQSTYVIDSKAMRKIGDGETLVLMVETSAADCQVNPAVRFLVKLP